MEAGKIVSMLSTGLELILNASEGALQIAVTENEQPLCFEEWFAPQRATEILAPALDNICKRLGISMHGFRRIACVCGPGSFTGIRLVLATASAVRRVTKAQLANLDYLQALATSAVMRGGLLYGQKVFVLTHARNGLAHFREFVSYGPQIPAQPVNEVRLAPPEEALGKISLVPCHVCGSALARYPAYFSQPVTGQGPAGAPRAILLPGLVNPDLDALRLLARHGDYFPKDLDPVYVRSCDAVDNLDDIAKKQGKDENEAREAMNKLLTRKPESEI